MEDSLIYSPNKSVRSRLVVLQEILTPKDIPILTEGKKPDFLTIKEQSSHEGIPAHNTNIAPSIAQNDMTYADLSILNATENESKNSLLIAKSEDFHFKNLNKTLKLKPSSLSNLTSLQPTSKETALNINSTYGISELGLDSSDDSANLAEVKEKVKNCRKRKAEEIEKNWNLLDIVLPQKKTPEQKHMSVTLRDTVEGKSHPKYAESEFLKESSHLVDSKESAVPSNSEISQLSNISMEESLELESQKKISRFTRKRKSINFQFDSVIAEVKNKDSTAAENSVFKEIQLATLHKISSNSQEEPFGGNMRNNLEIAVKKKNQKSIQNSLMEIPVTFSDSLQKRPLMSQEFLGKSSLKALQKSVSGSQVTSSNTTSKFPQESLQESSKDSPSKSSKESPGTWSQNDSIFQYPESNESSNSLKGSLQFENQDEMRSRFTRQRKSINFQLDTIIDEIKSKENPTTESLEDQENLLLTVDRITNDYSQVSFSKGVKRSLEVFLRKNPRKLTQNPLRGSPSNSLKSLQETPRKASDESTRKSPPKSVSKIPITSPKSPNENAMTSPKSPSEHPGISSKSAHESPGMSPKSAHESLRMSPKSARESPVTSPKSARESPVTSPKSSRESPMTSPKPQRESPVTSPKPQRESPVTSPKSAHESPEMSPKSAHESPEMSPKSSRESPMTSPKSARESPVTSPKSAHESPVTSPKSALESPMTSPKSALESPMTSPKPQRESPVTSPKSAHESPGMSPKSSRESPMTSPKSARESPGVSPKSAHESPGMSPKSARESPVTSPKSAHESPVTSPKFARESPVTSPKSAHESPGMSPKSARESPMTSPKPPRASPVTSPKSAHKTAGMSPKSSNTSPWTSPKSAHESPGRSLKSQCVNAMTSPKSFRKSPIASSKSPREIPIASPKPAHTTPGTSSKFPRESPGTSPKSSCENAMTSPKSAHTSPWTSPKFSHENAMTSPESARESPGTSPKSPHENSMSSPKSPRESPGTSPKSAHEIPEMSPKSARESPVASPKATRKSLLTTKKLSASKILTSPNFAQAPAVEQESISRNRTYLSFVNPSKSSQHSRKSLNYKYFKKSSNKSLVGILEKSAKRTSRTSRQPVHESSTVFPQGSLGENLEILQDPLGSLRKSPQLSLRESSDKSLPNSLPGKFSHSSSEEVQGIQESMKKDSNENIQMTHPKSTEGYLSPVQKLFASDVSEASEISTVEFEESSSGSEDVLKSMFTRPRKSINFTIDSAIAQLKNTYNSTEARNPPGALAIDDKQSEADASHTRSSHRKVLSEKSLAHNLRTALQNVSPKNPSRSSRMFGSENSSKNRTSTVKMHNENKARSFFTSPDEASAKNFQITPAVHLLESSHNSSNTNSHHSFIQPSKMLSLKTTSLTSLKKSSLEMPTESWQSALGKSGQKGPLTSSAPSPRKNSLVKNVTVLRNKSLVGKDEDFDLEAENIFSFKGDSSKSKQEKDGSMKQLTLAEFLEKMTSGSLPRKEKPQSLSVLLKAPFVLREKRVVKTPKPAVKKQKAKGSPSKPRKKNLPRTMNRNTFEHYLQHKVSKETAEAFHHVMETFWKNLASDLDVLLTAKRDKTLNINHVYILMKQLKLVSSKEEMHAMMQEYLPVDEWQKVIPAMYAFNQVFPKPTNK